MIAITTMDAIPNLCYECPCHDGENGTCNVDKEQRYISEYRPYWCPLQSVQNNPNPYTNLQPYTHTLHVDSKLEPCPFCGNAKTLKIEEVHNVLDDVEYLQFRVVCDALYKGCGGASGFKSSKEKAIKAWNERK